MNVVEEQYTNWVYPIPIEDMRYAISTNKYIEIGDPVFTWPIYWPHRREAENLDILIAGCGTVQAAYHACRNSNWNVLGLDLSDGSLAHQQKLKDKHNLTNLRLKKMSLLEVESLGESFDYIVSTGVLHHMPDPDAGLSALKNVLRPEGVMNLMVYGRSLRLGVYVMQEVFKILDFNQVQEDVDIVKQTIKSLPNDHVVQKYVKVASDLHYDAGFVDTFLHPQDRAYSVKEIYEFTRKAGLEFLSWADPLPYSLEAAIPKAHPLWQKLENLSPEISAHVCDLIVQDQGTHRWCAAHPDYVKKIQIPFDKPEFLDCFVSLHSEMQLIKPGNSNTNEPAVLKRGNMEFSLDNDIAKIIDNSEINTNIGLAISKAAPSLQNNPEFEIKVRDTFKYLWRNGHICILLPEEKNNFI